MRYAIPKCPTCGETLTEREEESDSFGDGFEHDRAEGL